MDSPGKVAIGAEDDTLDLRELYGRLARNFAKIVGLALVGIVVGGLSSFLFSRIQPITTSTRIVFSFPGFESGEYPDKSKFQPDDLRAPAIIAEAIKRQNLDGGNGFQGKVRGGVNVEGIVPPNIVKERDRLRATGQTLRPYVPDEYIVSLSLPRVAGLSEQQRNALLNEIVNVYRENFNATYADVPKSFGGAFGALRQADFPEYQLILDKEIESISDYLDQLLSPRATKDPETSKEIERTNSFRSPTTNLSFKDLLEQTQLFAQIRLNETLGLIYQNGLSRDRSTALVKMDYYLRVLENQEHRATEEENVVRGLLAQSMERSQNYVLGIKSQATAPRDTPLLDQGLVDSLLANDAYNFLVRQTLQAGLKVKQIQAEKIRLAQLRENMKSFTGRDVGDQAQILSRVNTSLHELEIAYERLIVNIRNTHADFARQQYGDAIRISAEIHTETILKSVLIACALGAFFGGALGAGLSLLGTTSWRRSA